MDASDYDYDNLCILTSSLKKMKKKHMMNALNIIFKQFNGIRSE